MRGKMRAEEIAQIEGPVRRCVACGTHRAKDAFLRVLRTKDGTVTLDATGRGCGRGAYLCKDPACLKRADKSRALERALGRQIPADVREQLQEEMNAIESIESALPARP